MIPEPNYEYEIKALVDAFKRAALDIRRTLLSMDLMDLSRAQEKAALAEVIRILRELDETSTTWVEENIPKAALDGVVRALVSLDVEDAVKVAKFNRVNQRMVAAAVADTQADLLAVTQNMERKVKAAIRKAVGESIRGNLAAGINGRRTISNEILTRMRTTLGNAVDTGIIDAAGRRWRPEVYTDMVTRTKMMRTHMEATENEAMGRGVQYGKISRHGATDACRLYEGKVVKLTPDAPGDYPYVGDLRQGRDIFHPNCRHLVSPIRNPEG